MNGGRGARLRRFVLLPACVIVACGTGVAHAEGRFGDSTWVAPGASFDAKPSDARVAAPDHERGWETALRAPFRMVFVPMRAVAMAAEAVADVAGSRFDPDTSRPRTSGVSIQPRISFDGLDDIGAGPAVTWIGFPTSTARLQLAGTWSPVDHRRVRLTVASAPRRPLGVRVRADYDSKPNRRHFGIGNDTPETDRSYYLLERASADGALLVGASPLRQLRIVGGYSAMSPRRGYHGRPLLEDVSPPGSVPFEHRATRELLAGVSGDLAALDEGRDPSRGVHGRAEFQRASGLRSRDPDYDQWWLEGRGYVPVFAKRRVIVVRGVLSGVEPRGDTSILPFYRLAVSDGASRFAGYHTERFRDRRLALARIEYRWVIVRRLNALALYERSAVAPRMESFTFRDAHEAWGGGLRLALNEQSTLRFELARSVEGNQAALVVGGDF